MRYAELKTNDVANGEGVRVTLFVSGCGKRCEGCHNPEAQSFLYGEEFGSEELSIIDGELRKPWVKGITFCGGEPLHPKNLVTVITIARWAKRCYPEKDIWCYTGYKFEEIEIAPLQHIDILVDGEYIESRKDPSLWFRGSDNQRIIDVQESLRKGNVVLWQR